MATTVTAKFYVGEIAERSNHPNPNYPIQKQVHVTLFPVINGSEENKQFYQYTPIGKIDLGILNTVASDVFEIGKEYYVNFTPAE